MTTNIAAVIVLQCETDARLRAEAEQALEETQRAQEARRALRLAFGAYDS